LLKRTVAHVIVNDKKMEWSRDYFDYKRVDGILYPHGFYWYYGNSKSKKKAIINKVEFNITFPNNHFTISKQR
jgi:hypothetical protein